MLASLLVRRIILEGAANWPRLPRVVTSPCMYSWHDFGLRVILCRSSRSSKVANGGQARDFGRIGMHSLKVWWSTVRRVMRPREDASSVWPSVSEHCAPEVHEVRNARRARKATDQRRWTRWWYLAGVCSHGTAQRSVAFGTQKTACAIALTG
jgi:hypothetical protein